MIYIYIYVYIYIQSIAAFSAQLHQATDIITCSPAKASTRLGAARFGPSPWPRRLLKLLPWSTDGSWNGLT